MYPQILHIYGPFAINSYGLMIALALMLFLWLTTRDPRRAKIISTDQLSNALMVGVVAGLLGGRLLYFLSEQHHIKTIFDFFALWQGGLSILGAIIAILICVPLYLRSQNIKILPFFDLVALYAPLLQGISRIGCFLAGCCYGIHTNLPWAFTYTNPKSLAPLCLPLHPTQLYSAASFFCIFIFMKLYGQRRYKKPGQIISLYLLFLGLERFFIDFWRGDRLILGFTGEWLSTNQFIALGIILVGLFGFIRSSR
ncbi:MAG: prolipoprotein diacylglyceryl transferase [Candidatus Babeliales bacterium]